MQKPFEIVFVPDRNNNKDGNFYFFFLNDIKNKPWMTEHKPSPWFLGEFVIFSVFLALWFF